MSIKNAIEQYDRNRQYVEFTPVVLAQKELVEKLVMAREMILENPYAARALLEEIIEQEK